MSPYTIATSLFISGLALGSGPCLASCGPILISYIAGTGKNIPRALAVYLIFSIARVAAYILLALIVFAAGQYTLNSILEDYARVIYLAGGILVITMGSLTILGTSLEFGAARLCHRVKIERDRGASVALMGFFMGLAPCGPLIAILTYIGLVARSWPSAVGYGLIFGIGTILSPLAFLAVFAGLLKRLRARIPTIYEKIFRSICGLIVIYFGIQLFIRGLHY